MITGTPLSSSPRVSEIGDTKHREKNAPVGYLRQANPIREKLGTVTLLAISASPVWSQRVQNSTNIYLLGAA